MYKNDRSQFEEVFLYRELKKALIGFQACPSKYIITGGWGTGAFNGDPYLKLLIQLYAAVKCNKQLIYSISNNILYNKIDQFIKTIKVPYSPNSIIQEIIKYKKQLLSNQKKIHIMN
jgi:poly(ADP-ribose) glycohydrolase